MSDAEITTQLRSLLENKEARDALVKIITLLHCRLHSNKQSNLRITTNGGGGIQFNESGCHGLVAPGGSVEQCSVPNPSQTGQLAKTICAENGDILIQAINGNLKLDAKNIYLTAHDMEGGRIILSSANGIRLEGGSNISATGATLDFSSAGSVIRMGTCELGTYGEVSNQNTTGTDALDTTFLGKILKAIKDFKEYFKSKCDNKGSN